MTDGLEYLGRARMQGVTLLIVAFLVGVLAGVAGDRVMTSRPPDRPGPHGGPGREGGPPHGRRLPPMLEELGLSAEQHTAIESLLARVRPRNRAIMDEVMPRLRAVSDSLQAEIRALLTPEQQARFDASVLARSNRPMLLPPPEPGGLGDGGPPPGMHGREGGPPPRDGEGGPPPGEGSPPH